MYVCIYVCMCVNLIIVTLFDSMYVCVCACVYVYVYVYMLVTHCSRLNT